jgi:hypothetical protein
METAQADGMDSRGNGVQFPAQVIDFSLLDMVMTGIRLFKNFNDIPSAMAYIMGSDAEVIMRSGIASGGVLVCITTLHLRFYQKGL